MKVELRRHFGEYGDDGWVNLVPFDSWYVEIDDELVADRLTVEQMQAVQAWMSAGVHPPDGDCRRAVLDIIEAST